MKKLNDPLLISFSGGKTSAFMTKFIIEHYGINENTHIVFANTGKEKEETLEFVRDCELNWGIKISWIESDLSLKLKPRGANYKEVDFETASRNGEPFQKVIQKYGIPNRVSRFCSGIMKKEIIQQYMKDKGYKKWTTAIGIRADEPDRVREYWYPLYEIGVTKQIVDLFWERQSFNLMLKPHQGNCDLCHLKSMSKRKKILQENPKIAEWWIKMEEMKNSTFDSNFSVKEILSAVTNQTNLFSSEYDISCFCGD